MNATIKVPKPKVGIEKFTYNPDIIWHSTDKLKIMRIELDENYTKIDFIHYADPKYKNGGWVRINANTYIQPYRTDIKLGLIRAMNIPIAPNMYNYTSKNACLYFTLYFPALSKEVKKIDIIEEGNINPFRFRGVSITKIKTEAIVIKN